MEEMKQAELVQEDVIMGADTSNSQDSTGLQITFPGESAQKEMSVIQILAGAVKDKSQLEIIEKLIALKNEEEDRRSKKAYYEDLAKLQAELPEIKRTKKGHNCKYAPLDAIINQVTPFLTKYGFSRSFSQIQTGNKIQVTCYLHHKDGYTDSSTLEGEPDTSGNKNDIQSVGSTVSYLRRYTFECVVGIASGEEDTDGNKTSPEEDFKIMKLYRFAIVGLLSLDVFSDEDKKQFKVAVKNLKTVADYKTYYEITLQKKEKRSAELKKVLDEAVNEPQKKPLTDKKPINSPLVMENQPQKGELFNIDSKVGAGNSSEIPEIGMEDIF